tara:strand:+ start:990 stop:1487 length:498 start_codon:yes stop_codon:yes gene_type:complete
MKILITGGVKSGKSRHAEKRILKIANGIKPLYLATTELKDFEMKKRIANHQQRRGNTFDTIEEPLRLFRVLKNIKCPVLIECMTMWLNNALHYEYSEIKVFEEIDNLLALECDVIFVLNEVGLGIIPDNPLARKFSDISGRIAQRLGEACDEVIWCVAGNTIKIK